MLPLAALHLQWARPTPPQFAEAATNETHTTVDSCDGAIIVQNHCLLWSKFVNTHTTPDSGLTYTYPTRNQPMTFQLQVQCLMCHNTIPPLMNMFDVDVPMTGHLPVPIQEYGTCYHFHSV